MRNAISFLSFAICRFTYPVNAPMALITQAEAARILGVKSPTIHSAVKAGRISYIKDDKGRKLIDGSTLLDEYSRNTQTRKNTAHRSTPQPRQVEEGKESVARMSRTVEYIPDYDESRARTEHLKAELLELDRKQKEGLLVPAADVQSKWLEIITLSRTKILGIPSKAKQRIPDLDATAMSALEDLIRETLEDLAAEGGEEV